MKNIFAKWASRVIIEIVIVLFLLNGIAIALPSEEWNRTYGGKSDDSVYSVSQTHDGGYIIVGQYNNFVKKGKIKKTFSINDYYDGWIINVDAKGNPQWNKKLGKQMMIDWFTSLQETDDGGYILSGVSNSNDKGEDIDAWVVKTDINGIQKVSKTFGGKNDDKANSILKTSDGGYIIIGGNSLQKNVYDGTNNYDAWIFKIDNNLNEQWSNTFGGNDEAKAVQETSDGGYLLTGTTLKTEDRGTDAYLIKVDAKGNLQWKQTFGGKYDDSSSSLLKTTDGGFIFAGNTHSKPTGKSDADAWLVKVDASGMELWSKTYGGQKDDVVTSIQNTTDGGFVLAGYTESLGNLDALLIKTDSNGDKVWSKTFGGDNNDLVFSVQQTSSGAFILAGQTSSYGNGSADAWLIKVFDDTIPSTIKLNSTTQTIPTATIPATTATTTPIETTNQIQTEKSMPTSPAATKQETRNIPGFKAIITIIVLVLIYCRGRIK